MNASRFAPPSGVPSRARPVLEVSGDAGAEGVVAHLGGDVGFIDPVQQVLRRRQSVAAMA